MFFRFFTLDTFLAYLRLLCWKFCRLFPVFPRVKILSIEPKDGSYNVQYKTLISHNGEKFSFGVLTCIYAWLLYKRKKQFVRIRTLQKVPMGTIVSLRVKEITLSKAEQNSLPGYDPLIREYEITTVFISPAQYEEREKELKQKIAKREKFIENHGGYPTRPFELAL